MVLLRLLVINSLILGQARGVKIVLIEGLAEKIGRANTVKMAESIKAQRHKVLKV